MNALDELKRVSLNDSYTYYEELIPYLNDHGLKPIFNSGNGANCDRETARLAVIGLYALGGTGHGRADLEAAYWYSLYVNSTCASPDSQAVYLMMLAELDRPAADAQLAKLELFQSSFPKGPRFLSSTCRLRAEMGKIRREGLLLLDKAKLYRCDSRTDSG